jgi:chromosome segregation ATPase
MAEECLSVIENGVQHVIELESSLKINSNMYSQENTALKKRVEDLTTENKQFVSLLKKHQASISDNLVYADKFLEEKAVLDALRAQVTEIRSEAEQCRRDLADVRVKEQQVLQSFYEQREQDIGQFRMALESRDREKDEMKAQIELTKKQAEDERFKWSQEIQARDDNLAKKQKEIDDLKKEVIKNNQQHEQQLQRLRTKYEEQMLQLTQIGRK